ncbi:MAG: LacI family DNA-binding transcriptional regulator [Solirubrobacteraceae bacterium]
MLHRTIAEVARHASVSPATVSRVLNGDPRVGDDLRRRVLASVATLEYRPNRLARNLRKRSTQTIGVVVPDIENPHFGEMVRAVEDTAYARGYRVLICNTDETPEKQHNYLIELADERVCGVILSPSEPADPAIAALVDSGIHVTAFDREVADARIDVVIADNVAATRAATELLLDAGHRDVALVAGRQDVETGAERREGFELAMHAAGLEPRAVDGRFRIEGGREAVRALLADPSPPSAIVVANNLMTVGALLAVREAGLRVPGDLAVVGIDDPVWASLADPPLTTVAQPVRRMAMDAMELLLERVAGARSEPRRVVHPFELRRRESCGTAARS